MNEYKVTDEILATLAERAGASPLTVMRRLLSLPVRGSVGDRVDEAIAGWRRENHYTGPRSITKAPGLGTGLGVPVPHVRGIRCGD